ncbi:MAG: hypothetical protein LLG06_02765 [Desulfobacteraceae bacterium]|nr:hypothetical protein [Desulfobacteraceae bacterium]
MKVEQGWTKFENETAKAYTKCFGEDWMNDFACSDLFEEDASYAVNADFAIQKDLAKATLTGYISVRCLVAVLAKVESSSEKLPELIKLFPCQYQAPIPNSFPSFFDRTVGWRRLIWRWIGLDLGSLFSDRPWDRVLYCYKRDSIDGTFARARPLNFETSFSQNAHYLKLDELREFFSKISPIVAVDLPTWLVLPEGCAAEDGAADGGPAEEKRKRCDVKYAELMEKVLPEVRAVYKGMLESMKLDSDCDSNLPEVEDLQRNALGYHSEAKRNWSYVKRKHLDDASLYVTHGNKKRNFENGLLRKIFKEHGIPLSHDVLGRIKRSVS